MTRARWRRTLRSPTRASVETCLRPRRLAEYIGQTQVKENLAHPARGRAPARTRRPTTSCSTGRPGLGKTTLANIIARELGVNIHTTSGPAIERPGDLAAILTNLDERDVLFIDEIHRLNHSVEEILYPAMEDFAIDVMIGRGPSARSLRLSLKPFTVVGATTRAGRISSPLRDRFGAVYRLDYYAEDELAKIVRRSAGHPRRGHRAGRGRRCSRAGGGARRASSIGCCGASGTTPRCWATVASRAHQAERRDGRHGHRRRGSGHHRPAAARGDRPEVRAPGPVGGAAVAAVIGEEVDTIEDVYEPYLLQLGFLDRTPQGRVATERARDHLRALGYDVPPPRRADRTDRGPVGRHHRRGSDRERDCPRDACQRRSRRSRIARARLRRDWPIVTARPGQELRPRTALAGPRPVRAARPGLRLPRAERLGQDDRAAPADRPPPAERGHDRAARPARTRGATASGIFRVGSLIETPSFYPYLSGRENLLVFARGRAADAQTRIDQVLECVGMRDRARTRSRPTRWA